MSVLLATSNLPELREHLVSTGPELCPAWTVEEISHVFRTGGAMWWYKRPISPDKPHVIMRDQRFHTDVFVNCMEALKESVILTALAHQIWIRAMKYTSVMGVDDWVIGTERAGAPIAQEVACLIGCRHATVEKDADGNPTVFNRFEIGDGEHVLLVNDLLSHTDGSTYMSKVAVEQACPGAMIYPVAWHLVNRSGKDALADETPVKALLDIFPREMPADDCEYCQAGSEALKFKPNRKRFFGSA